MNELKSDFRTKCVPFLCFSFVVGLTVWIASPVLSLDDEPKAQKSGIDATTLHHKVLCGYQGWFRCPGDPAEEGWKHWSRNSNRLTAKSLTFEMWPDMTDYSDDEKYAVPGFTYPDGKLAHLFSSAHPKAVERHFKWMEQYGIDGVFVQRFLTEIANPSTDRVLKHVRASAASTGRVYAICYDMSGSPQDRLFSTIVDDWKRLMDEQKVTQDPSYLHHNGKPVVFVWGFFSDRFGPALANMIIDFFKTDKRYGATLVGGCQWPWRTEKNSEWAKVFRRFDVISPWNVGHTMMVNNQKHATTDYWKDDIAEADKNKMAYLPVIYPGFSWTNLKGKSAAKDIVPRQGGEFYWRQFDTAANLGVEMAYVAMFDEVDEGTAIFKVSNSPPSQGQFQTYEGLPSDWYLRLTGEGTKVIRGERKSQPVLPIKP